MQRIVPLTVLSLMLAGCGEAPGPVAVAEPAALFSGAPIVTTGPFFPVAECSGDIGFDIRFGGERVLMTHTTTDKKGRTHQTMHFRVQDFMGWRMPEPAPPTSAPDYAVQGGAEMFSTHRESPGGPIIVQIHQGNLVFVHLVTGQRVIAHHTIRNVPGQGSASYWSCRIAG